MLGAHVADAVVHVEGGRLVPLAPDAEPDVVDLRTRLDHAAGRKARHVQSAIAAEWPGRGCIPTAMARPGTRSPEKSPPAVKCLQRSLRTGV